MFYVIFKRGLLGYVQFYNFLKKNSLFLKYSLKRMQGKNELFIGERALQSVKVGENVFNNIKFVMCKDNLVSTL